MQKKHGRRALGVLCMAAGVLLIAAAAGLLLFNLNEDARAGDASGEVMPELRQDIENASASDPADGETSEDETGLGLPTVEIDGQTYIGYLTIPVLELELPVASSWDYAKLKISPCRFYGSSATDDLVICGHNYKRHFGRLKNLQIGDIVTYVDATGTTNVYEVKAMETLKPTQTAEMIGSSYDLTLYTCTYGSKARVTVRCNRVEN